MRSLIVLLTALVAVAGCTASTPPRKTSSTVAKPSPSAPSSSAYSPAPGDDAVNIASHIPGCAHQVVSESVGKGGPALTSAASCTVGGHTVILDAWASAADAEISFDLTKPQHVYYALGSDWCAFLADQGATPDQTTLQMQLTNDAAGLLDQQFNSDAHTPVPVATQRSVTAMVAAALGGTTAST